MGWWTLNQSGQKLLQGDTPYDIMGDAFEQITHEYQKEWKRKPTLVEIVKTIEAVLVVGIDDFLVDGGELEITYLAVKTKKRKKSQVFQVGDFFAIPLKGKRYAFGRIFSDLNVREMGMLIGIYAKVSTRLLNPIKLKKKELMFAPFYYGGETWKSWKWKIIGNIPIESDEFTYPKHKEGAEGMGWWIRDRDGLHQATEDDVRGLEYATLWSTKAVEEGIEEFLKKTPVR